jgi:hypothetical protein
MITAAQALSAIPAVLRDPLLAEYREIVKNFMERRWSPSELSAGRFCEIVYTILDGFAAGSYAPAPWKPANFVQACKALESKTNVPRSFQILIPRMLPALYEVRNNRGVGHVDGDVDPNHMDAVVVLSMCNWIVAELVRVFHGTSADAASKVVDSIVERRVPLVWQGANTKRVLDPNLSLKDSSLLLIAESPSAVDTDNLFKWTGYGHRGYFLRLLRQLHAERLVELSADETTIEILPPGSKYVEELIAAKSGPG